MAKTYLPAGGGLTFKSVLRFVGPSPLDGRGVVDSLKDISGQAYKTTFGGSEFEDVASYYEGMLVVTKDTGKLYVLNGGTFKEVTPDLSGIQGVLDEIPNTYVPKTLTINGKALNGNITLSATDIGLGNVTNLAASGYLTALTSDVTDAIKITVGGTTKEIKVATLKTSLGLGYLAYKDSLSFQDVGALSATGTAVKALALALTQAVGDTKTPVYFNAEGKPVALSYTIKTSVPANAVFTDTTYSNENGITLNRGKFGLNLNSTTSLGTIGQNKVYAVGLDASGKVAVKVDWTDEKVNVSNLRPTAPAPTKHYVTTALEAGKSSLDIANDSLQGVYVERDQIGTSFVAPAFKGALKGNADTATEANYAINADTATNAVSATSSDHAVLADDLGGKPETHEENFVYQPTAADLSVKDGFATIKKLKGNTVVWNQRCVISAGNCSITNNSENSYIATPTKTGGPLGSHAWLCGWVHFNRKVIAEHKYLIKAKVTRLGKRQDVDDFTPDRLNVMIGGNYKYFNCNIGESVDVNIIIKSDADGDAHISCNDCIIQIDKPQLFDLTQMFGKGNEPATVKEFEAMFPNDYYEYNAGELMSFDGKGLKSVGFNQWDEEWEVGTINNADGQHLQSEEIRSRNYIPVISGATYYCNYTGKGSVFAWFYDSEHNYIGKNTQVQINNAEFAIPANAKYMRIATLKGGSITYNHDICINLVHSGYRNGEYEPYEDYTLLFNDGNTISQLTGKLNGEGESVTIFPDGLRSAGTAYDEIVYDETTGKHKAIKRIGSVDMVTLDYKYGSNTNLFFTHSITSIPKIKTHGNVINVNYPQYTGSVLKMPDKRINTSAYYYSNAIIISDFSYTDVDSFKASLQGQILYYELAEPEVYELDFPINTSYEAYDFGTEEVLYNDDKEINIPLKASIEYGFNAVDMIRNNYFDIQNIKKEVYRKQDSLVSGINIKTINGESLLGEGNIAINAEEPDLSNYYTKSEIDNTIGDINNILESIINT